MVMPNLSPKNFRNLYTLYDNKISTDEEAAETLSLLKHKVSSTGYNVVIGKGGVKK